jgi:hypothetical protein
MVVVVAAAAAAAAAKNYPTKNSPKYEESKTD